MTPSSLEGRMLGKYRVMDALGRGGMAQVYRAFHPQLERYVAIKVLRSDLVEEEEFLVRFRREAKAVAALRHPHIVQVFDFDVEDDLYYMVMELLEGDTLKAYLNSYRTRGERMPLGEMVRILLDVMDGLAYAHAEGIVHRDIKPANVLLTRRGQAVLTDFGIAQIVGTTRYTMSGALMGTLNYMAPEQGLEGHGEVRSDIYSIGIMFFEMVTGRTPYDADTPLAILMKHLNDPLPLPHKLAPDLPEALEREILKALAKQPEDRYASAVEMAKALEEAAAEAGIEVPERISLPQVKELQPPAAPAAVFSGEARQHISDHGFAVDDTDADLARRLAEQPAEMPAGAVGVVEGAASMAEQPPAAVEDQKAEGQAGEDVIKLGVTFGELGSRFETDFEELGTRLEADFENMGVRLEGRVTAQVKEAVASMTGKFDAPREAATKVDGTSDTEENIVFGSLRGVGVLAGVNLVGLFLGGMTGNLGIFGLAWPAELALVAYLLAQVMAALSLMWIAIPIGILLINAVLLGYSSLTGLWWQWMFLGPLDVGLIVWISLKVLYAVRKHDSLTPYAIQLARKASLASAIVASAIILLAIFVHVGLRLVDLFVR